MRVSYVMDEAIASNEEEPGSSAPRGARLGRGVFAAVAVAIAVVAMLLSDWLANRPGILASPWRDGVSAQLVHVGLVYVVVPIALLYAVFAGALSAVRRRARDWLSIAAFPLALGVALWAILGTMPSGVGLGDRLLAPHITPYGEEPRPQPAPWYEVTLDVAPETKGEGIAVDYGLAQELNGEPVIGYAIVAKGVGRVFHNVEVRNGTTVKVLDFDGVEIPLWIDAKQRLNVGESISVPVAHGWMILIDFTAPRGPELKVRGKAQIAPAYVLVPLGRNQLGGKDVPTDIMSREAVRTWLQLK